MKYVYAFLAALLLVGISAFPLNDGDNEEISDLYKDIGEFYHLLPYDKIQKVTEDHADDPKLWEAIEYILSDDYHKLVYAVEDLPEFHKYVLFLQAVGYNVIREIRVAHEILKMKEYVPPNPMTQEVKTNLKKGGGFYGYLEDLFAILPSKELKALHAKKVKESPAFAKFNAAILSREYDHITTELWRHKTTQALLYQSWIHDFDLQRIHSFKMQILGFNSDEG